MASVYFRRGNRLFVVASALTVLVAILHTTALLNDAPTEEYAAAMTAMNAASLDLGSFHTDLYHVFESVWIQVGVLMLLLAGKNFLLLASAPAELATRLVRAMSSFDCAAYAGLAAMFVYYQIPPPLFSYAVLSVLFLMSAINARTRGQTGEVARAA